jgi:hypothetical protein
MGRFVGRVLFSRALRDVLVMGLWGSRGSRSAVRLVCRCRRLPRQKGGYATAYPRWISEGEEEKEEEEEEEEEG